MVGILASTASQALQYQSVSSQSSSSQLSLDVQNGRHGRHPHDRLDLSSEAQERLSSQTRALNALGRNESILRGQRISFLQKQLSELNDQIQTLRGLLEFANAGQAETLRSGIRDVGNQLEGVGRDIQGLVQSSSTSISIEAVQGSFSESFNAVAANEDGTLAVSQQLEGEFSFYKVTVEEQSTSVAFDSDGNLSIEQTTTQSEIVVSQLNVESSQTIAAIDNEDPLQSLIASYDDTSNNFEDLVNDTLEALEVNDGGVDQLLAALTDYIEDNRFDFFA